MGPIRVDFGTNETYGRDHILMRHSGEALPVSVRRLAVAAGQPNHSAQTVQVQAAPAVPTRTLLHMLTAESGHTAESWAERRSGSAPGGGPDAK
jgi:hypothetical protein